MAASELRLATILSVPFEENTYIAHLEGRQDCLIFDPGMEPDKILDFLDQKHLIPAAILNTHGHADHIAGNQALKQRWPECPIVIGATEADKLTDARLNLSADFGLPIVSPPADVTLTDGETYSAAGIPLEILEIPGHSAGHIALLNRAESPFLVFVGDVIFAGAIGRTDFPDGDFNQLATGIRQKLYTLPDDTILLSGHGPPTTVLEEKTTNPFVQAVE